ncbi:MAG TPA: AAA family ATPase, partial [Candidatus Choladousia intestinigallinarum]|nr:AAA family ATPase [Candidatus Choladousia intestinigallinarum]
PMVKEWADMVLFANYKTHVIKVDGKNKAQGGQRVMYTTHHSCWDAKNRYGLPDEVPFSYDAIAHVLGTSDETQTEVRNTFPTSQNHPDASAAQPAEETSQPVSDSYASVTEPRQMEMSFSQPEDDSSTSDLDPRIPKNLRDLMAANQVCEWDIQNVVEARGYVPSGTPIWEYDTVNPGIVDGLLVASWAQVYAAIKEMKEKQEIPFN